MKIKEKSFTPLEKIIFKLFCKRIDNDDSNLMQTSIYSYRKNSLTGFTLIELIVVVIIIGILATIGLPQFNKVVEKSRRSEAINMLTRMYRGYKTLLVDEVVDGDGNFINGTNPALFNPDESNTTPNSPSGRSVMSWGALEFNQNPNYQSDNLYFSYDFLKDEEYSETGQGRINGNGRPPDSSEMTIGVAWRKTSNDKSGDQLFPVDFSKWIFINMNTGQIFKSDNY